jgi:hypothetical protein
MDAYQLVYHHHQASSFRVSVHVSLKPILIHHRLKERRGAGEGTRNSQIVPPRFFLGKQKEVIFILLLLLLLLLLFLVVVLGLARSLQSANNRFAQKNPRQPRPELLLA